MSQLEIKDEPPEFNELAKVYYMKKTGSVEKPQEVNEFGNVISRYKYLILLFAILGGYGGYKLSISLPVLYGYTMLLEPPKIIDDSKSSSSLSPILGLMKNENIGKQIISYVEFKYVDLKRDRFAPATFLEAAKLNNDETTIVMTIHAPSLIEAKNFGEKIFTDIREYYQPKIEEKMHAYQTESTFITNQIKTLEETREKIKAAHEALGYSPALLQQESEIQNSLIQLRKSNLILTTMMSNSSTYNTRVKFARPVKSEPINLPFLAFVIVGCMGMVCFILSFLAVGVGLGLISGHKS